MRIEKLNNNSYRSSFSSSLDVENFQNSPTLHNFKYLNQSDKLDALFLMLDKQNEKLNDLQREHILLADNQYKMNKFNLESTIYSTEKGQSTIYAIYDSYDKQQLNMLG